MPVLENCIRLELDANAPRRFAIIRPLRKSLLYHAPRCFAIINPVNQSPDPNATDK